MQIATGEIRMAVKSGFEGLFAILAAPIIFAIFAGALIADIMFMDES